MSSATSGGAGGRDERLRELVRVAMALACAAYAGVLLIAAVTLPDRVPIHFGPGGEADRIVGRQEALVTFAVLGLGIAVLMVGLARWMRRAPLTMVNVPHKDWWTATPAREARLRARLETDLLGIGALTMVLLVVVQAVTVRAADDPEPSLDPVAVAATVGYVALLLAAVLWIATRRYRPGTAS
ncbi:DUF1648 domain-containing protein [uncultured Nocardioides sp.]|uniref:DUF1648 domain-containing protein n=1 Tax=uncultured Nocardioides sp. TaxID=198441 RepID=UPI000C5CCE14|nr:hypothetical protein [Nocardioides sp.]|tara:strand:- start:145 stop:696 length:552 start_codon:yes stop_codon:yes gene_type:complete